MDPITIMAIAQGAVGLGKAAYGYFQRRDAERQRDLLLSQQPEFETPQSMQDLSSLYGQYLRDIERREGIPGQQQIESNIRESTAAGIQNVRETARTSTEALGATTDIIGKEIEGIQQLEIESARQKARQELNAMQMYGQALGRQAQYEQQAFQYNEFMPWQTQVAQAQAEFAGGQRTMQSGLSDIVSGATQYGLSEFTGNNLTQDGGQQNNNNQYIDQGQPFDLLEGYGNYGYGNPVT